ncbi:hypothetical protein H4S08_000096 [Coemansia sp. RSA 1365]|nr:hypothetical protein H4S08_000096 [Coemansia sp. RSA 1365]
MAQRGEAEQKGVCTRELRAVPSANREATQVREEAGASSFVDLPGFAHQWMSAAMGNTNNCRENSGACFRVGCKISSVVIHKITLASSFVENMAEPFVLSNPSASLPSA